MATDTMPLEGMPTHEGDLSIEAHGMDPIPESARYGSVGRVFTVWFTPNLVPAAFFIGTLVTLDFLKLGFVDLAPGDRRRQRRRLGARRAAVDDGPEDRHGPDAGGPAAVRQVDRAAGPAQLVQHASAGTASTACSARCAITLIIPAIPFWLALVVIVVCQGTLGIFGYEAIHLFEKWAAVVLGIMFVDPDHRDRAARPTRR